MHPQLALREPSFGLRRICRGSTAGMPEKYTGMERLLNAVTPNAKTRRRLKPLVDEPAEKVPRSLGATYWQEQVSRATSNLHSTDEWDVERLVAF